MKRCPFCANKIRTEAHHCQHCNNAVIDMDGAPIEAPSKTSSPNTEWLERAIKAFVTIFFAAQFFIYGLIVLRSIFGISIIKTSSGLSISINLILLTASVAGAMLLSPLIIGWVKRSFERVMK